MNQGPPLTLETGLPWVGDYPSEGSRLTPDRVAVLVPEKEISLTFTDFEQRIQQACQYLGSRELEAGDRVAYLGKNSDLFYILFFASIRMGLVMVPLNWRCVAGEVAFFIADSECKLLVTDEEFLDTVHSACSELDARPAIVVTEISSAGEAGLRQLLDSLSPAVIAVPRDDSICLQLYTSGTTGRPKGTLCTHRAISLSRFCEVQMPGFPDWSGETIISAMPHFHIGGISWMMMGLKRQSTCVLTSDPSPGNIVALLKAHNAGSTFTVATVIRGIIQELKATGERLPELKTIFYGASPIGEALLRETMETLGCQFGQFFGMTEVTGSVTFLAPEFHSLSRPETMASVGKVLPGMAVEIRDSHGIPLADGTNGEIWVKTPAIMAGYWRRQDATDEVLVDGWYRTGDGGRLDEQGFLYLTDRIKDMIVSGGENIYPNEVEEAIRGHPAVQDVAVIGLPDERWGEVVTAVIESVPGEQVDTAGLLEFLGTRLAAYKRPKLIKFRAALPRTASGKIQRAKARADLLEDRD
jgi:acyl-CoA synthetase (AMP-forming)/AMP-acid ligase II